MSIEKNSDLINFINDECKKLEEPNLNKIFKCFCKCFCKSLTDIWNKFKDIENLDLKESIILGSNMIYHIYWFLIVYANNLKLSIFLTERAILLYTEFIIMSRDPSVNKELYFTPTISDAVSFAYKKTIGPIKISSFIDSNSFKIIGIKNAASIIKHILQECFLKININHDNLILDDINDNLYGILLSIFTKISSDNVYTFIFDKTLLIFDEFNNLSFTIIFWKIYFEIFSEFLQRGRKIKILMAIMDKAYIVFTRKIMDGTYSIKSDYNFKMFKRMRLYTDLKIYVSENLRKYVI